jgi:transposase
MCQLLRDVAAEHLVGPVTVVLDNARDQQNKVVQGLAAELSIRLLDLPSDPPNLNLIERLWGFAKRRSVYGKYHPHFAAFRAAVEDTLSRVPTSYADTLESLITLRG